jgi:hypothetical protein
LGFTAQEVGRSVVTCRQRPEHCTGVGKVCGNMQAKTGSKQAVSVCRQSINPAEAVGVSSVSAKPKLNMTSFACPFCFSKWGDPDRRDWLIQKVPPSFR